MKKEMDQLMDHEYDGIQEYDNPLPRWWVWLFVISIIFGLCYLGYYLVLGGPGMIQVYEEEMQRAEVVDSQWHTAHPEETTAMAEATETAVDTSGQTPPETPSENAAIAAAPTETLVPNAEAGNVVFHTNCAQCHGNLAEGKIGPNLTDHFWIHGNTTEQQIGIVTNGVPEKGMLAWKGVLTPQNIVDVVAYVQTLQDTNPPGAKEAQGTQY